MNCFCYLIICSNNNKNNLVFLLESLRLFINGFRKFYKINIIKGLNL